MILFISFEGIYLRNRTVFRLQAFKSSSSQVQVCRGGFFVHGTQFVQNRKYTQMLSLPTILVQMEPILSAAVSRYSYIRTPMFDYVKPSSPSNHDAGRDS